MAQNLRNFWKSETVASWTGAPPPAPGGLPEQGDATVQRALDEQTDPAMPELEGTDMGQVQALGLGDITKIPGVGKVPGKVYDWATKSRQVKVIIKNNSDKVLLNKDKKAPGKSKWKNGVPQEVAAAKGGTPGEVTIIIESTWGAIGRAPGSDAGGGVLVYEVVGDDRQTKVKLTWPAKSVKNASSSTFQTLIPPSSSDRYQILGHDQGNDTFVFTFSSLKPADPKKEDPKKEDPKKEEPKPADPKVEKPAPVQKFDYTIGPFKVGSPSALESGSITKDVYDILHQKLSAETRDALIQGKLPGGMKIEVHGYTSNTDAADKNFELAKKRAKAVIDALKSVGLPASAFTEPVSHGEWQTGAPSDDKKQEKEDPNWRKVVVKVSQ